jgi:hypothetical protein
MNNALAQLMEENLKQVWSERDATRRMKAIENIYAKDSALYHVNDITDGHEAINKSVSNTLNSMPEEFVFTKLKPVIINNNIGRLIWGVGPKDNPPLATGMDIATFENGKIKSLYVFS